MFNKLRGFFGGKQEEPAPHLADFSEVVVDIHSHLIPCIDDGSQSMDDSIFMLRQFEALGYKKVITSPHVVSGGYDNSSEIILKGRDEVREAIKANGINIEFDAAAEYYLDETFQEKIEKRDLLTIGKNYVLVEFSFLSQPQNTREISYKLQTAGYKFILAHPERYTYYHDKSFSDYRSFKDRNIYFQINMLSLTGRYGKGAQAVAERMIDENMVDFIGTDLHSIKNMDLVKQAIGNKYLEKIVRYDKLLNKTLI